MVPSVTLPDARAASDALTFARRAALLPDSGVRLVAAGGVLTMSAAVLVPRSLIEPTPTVLALRALGVDPQLETDVVVDPGLLQPDPADAAAIVLPPVALRAAWAGISPPTGGWEQIGTVAASVIAALAHAGVAEVAQSLPQTPGEDIARSIRTAVWSRSAPEIGGLPAGAAFAALALGFIGGGEEARMLRSGAWHRITLQRGHVLVRGPVAHGLTAVRRTGG